MGRAKDPCINCSVLAKLVEAELVTLLLVLRYAVASLLPSLHTLAAQAPVMDALDEDLCFEDVFSHYFRNKHAIGVVQLLLLRCLAHVWLAEKRLNPLLVTGAAHGIGTTHGVPKAHRSGMRSQR